MSEVEDMQGETLKIHEEEEDDVTEEKEINGQGDAPHEDTEKENGVDEDSPKKTTDSVIGYTEKNSSESVIDYAEKGDTDITTTDHTTRSSSEPLIDYAKNTMNSFLSMYGYEESVTTETIKSKIKSEPSSPENKEKIYPSDALPANFGVKKLEDMKKDPSTSSPRTATVMPLQSTAKPERSAKIEGVISSVGTAGNVGPSGAQLSAPRKPVTPYMRYRNMIFEEIKHKFPGCSPYDLACLISSKWSMLTDSERKVWEDQYEQEVREYTIHLQEYSETLKTVYKNDPPAATASATAAVSKMSSPEETKAPVRRGSCNWCKKQAVLLDFSSVLDGREIYCTGLCSDKCFTEAAKQIVTIENGSTKPRYISGSRSQSQSREDVRVPSFAPPASHYPPLPPSATTTTSSDTSAPPPFQVFDWDRYLAETRSSAAPWLYFKQSRYPPSNNFVVGMKLEACNGQTMIGYSLATVVAVSGARILLHFDGSDASSDIWRLPDSGDIHPVGWTEVSQLKPPTGYKYDTTKYRRFHASSLQNAEIAPARLFKKEPRAPIENYFIAGMRLEAVMKQNPAVIGVATVRDTDEERIRIEFDGCKGSSYWTHYTDRDLFPAGWCSRSGHPLKPPGNIDTKAYMAAVAAQGSCSPSMVSTSSESRSSTGSPYVVYPTQASTSTTTPKESTPTVTWKEKSSGNNNVEIFINTDCYCGPYLDTRRVDRMQHVYRGSIVTVLKSVLEETIRCAIDSKTVFGFLKPGRGNCVVTATCDGMTYQCCLNSIDRVSTFWRVLEQFSDNLRCCPNLFSSVDYRQSCNRCQRSKNNNGEHSAHLSNKTSIVASGYSSSVNRRSETKPTGNNENHHKSRQPENHYESSGYTTPVYDREYSREELDTIASSRRDTNTSRQDYHAASLRHDLLRQEVQRQEAHESQDALRQSMQQHELHGLTSRQNSQDNIRQELSRSESLQLNSSYETLRQESYSSEGSKDDVFHTNNREDSKDDVFRSSTSPTESRKHDLDRENTPVDVTGSPPEKKKRVEKNEVSGVEITTAPKTWTIQQVIEFVEQTDLKDNVDKFLDNEIDGKALLLLKRDLVLSHMGFKLGPAVKLLDIIDELRAAQEKFV